MGPVVVDKLSYIDFKSLLLALILRIPLDILSLAVHLLGHILAHGFLGGHCTVQPSVKLDKILSQPCRLRIPLLPFCLLDVLKRIGFHNNRTIRSLPFREGAVCLFTLIVLE